MKLFEKFVEITDEEYKVLKEFCSELDDELGSMGAKSDSFGNKLFYFETFKSGKEYTGKIENNKLTLID